MRVLLLLICVMLAVIPLAGQNATIQGRVMNGEEPVPDARVTLLKNGVALTGTITEEDGRYQFTGLDSGNYAIRVVVEEYEYNIVIPIGNLGILETRLVPDIRITVAITCIWDDFGPYLFDRSSTVNSTTYHYDQIRRCPTQ